MTYKFTERSLMSGEANKIILHWITGEKTLALVMSNDLVGRVARSFPGKTTAPTANEDSGDGYIVGDIWLDETADKAYVCLDNTLTAAVWTEITQSGGSIGLNDLTDVDTTGLAQGNILYYNGSSWVVLAPGVSGQFLKTQGAAANPLWDTPAGSGDVVGPAASVDNAIARFNGATGKLLQDYTSNAPTISDTGDMNVDGDIDVDNVIVSGNVDGRDVSTDGSKLDGIEALADVTDATNVNAAGAVMESDYNANTILAATVDNTPAALTVAEQTLVGRITAGNITALTAAEVRTLLGLVIGTNVQAWDADLDYLAGFTPSANVKTILNAADYAAIRTALSLVIGTNVQAWDTDLDTWATVTPSANGQSLVSAANYAAMVALLNSSLPVEIGLAVSDEITDLTTGTAKITFRMPHAMTLTAVRANVNTAPVGSTIIVDINEGGVTILSTKLSIDASEKTSTTAATPAVISDSALADDAEITIDIDQIGSSTAGKGLKVWLIGTRA